MNQSAFIAELKARTDIYDIVSESVVLRKSGANWLGLCPFHGEKTPSFTVNPSKQIFHCFGCGTGGDVITFIMKQESLTFREAAELLARRCGLEMPGFNAGQAEQKDRLTQALEMARAFFRSHLSRDKRAREYLRTRGLTDAMINTFAIGASPEDWQALTRHLLAKKYPESLLVQAGLSAQGRNGNLYDVFRGRLMFPIHSLYGRTIGFGGRALLPNQNPKYLNSRESDVFLKHRTLYALDLAKDAIKNDGFAILTEGYLDVIACHQFGFRNAVATLGTAFTEGHAKLLKRFSDNVVLLFDGDAAGIKASRKALRTLIAAGISTRVLILPDNHDPDTFLRERGPDEFGSLLRNAEGLVDFLLADALRHAAPDQGVAQISDAVSVIADIANPIVQGQAIHSVSEKTGIPERFLIEELGRIAKTAPPPSSAPSASSSSAPPRHTRVLPEEILLAAALQSFERIRSLVDSFAPEDFLDDHVRIIFVKLTGLVRSAGAWDPDEFMASLPEGGCRSLFTRLRVEDSVDPENADAVFRESAESLRRRNTISSHKDLVSRIGRMDLEAMDQFMKEQRRIKKT